MCGAEAALIDSGIEEWELMRRAGHGAAGWIARLAAGGPVTVLCGPGDNGGDGYVAAAALKARGLPVRVIAPISPKTDQAKKAASTFEGKISERFDGVGGAVFVDAMFGIGLSRPLSDEHMALIQDLHSAHARSVALDVPSGLDAEDGTAPDGLSHFDLTLAFGAWKPAHFTGAALAELGTIRLVDIGVPDRGETMHLSLPARLSLPGFAAHKYSRGLVAVVGGEMPGASLLAARACALSGAGYVKWLSEHDHPGHPPDLVRDETPIADALTDKRIGSILAGPGLGGDERATARLRAALAAGKPLVLDADALNLLRPGMIENSKAANILLTPHEGELARLCDAFSVGGETKLQRASALSRASGCAVLAKGADTLLAAGDEIRFFVPASRWLSVAGSGDVLAGIAAARLAVTGDAKQAACEAVHLHGKAARIAGPGFTAAMLAEAVHPALEHFL